MNRLLYVTLVLTAGLFSCTKTDQTATPESSPNNGQWLWTGTYSGLFSTVSLVDSPVVLSLNSGNNYNVTLNGRVSLHGTYSTDTSAGWNLLKFDNIDEPAGNTTSVTSGNVTYLYFNYAQIGRMTLFQNNSVSLSITGDTLTILRYPITPETPISIFVRESN
jgi:hypothetical protein